MGRRERVNLGIMGIFPVGLPLLDGGLDLVETYGVICGIEILFRGCGRWR